MHKNYILAIVIIILIALGIILFAGKKETSAPTDINNVALGQTTNETVTSNVQNQNTTQATSTSPAVKNITVTYSDSGFSPSTVDIALGDSVTFKNETTGGMSVASDPHPDHTIYPEFDQYKTSQKGLKEFTFTFTKIGSWGYHNHANPTAVGTVIVK